MGSAGRATPPGRTARRVAPVVAVLAAVAAVLALVTWWQQRDLRDLDGLTRAPAEVVAHDSHRRGPDALTVTFPAGADPVEATVPYSGPSRDGDDVEVAYVPGHPERVRTVVDWDPAYRTWTAYALVLAAAAVLVGGFGLLSRRRGGRWETDAPAGVGAQEPLGRRVVRGSLAVQVMLAGGALVTGGVLGALAVTEPERRTLLVVSAVSLTVVLLGAAAGVHGWYGREGVWVSDAGLVARRRATVRCWPWAQVLELGMVVERGTATAAAARVDDGRHDGVGADGWVTLARPSAGPLGAHTWATRFRALAEERGLPFTEGLTDGDLADALGSTYLRRRPGRPSRTAAPDS